MESQTIDIGLSARLEQVQKRFMRRLLWREKLSYDERLKLVSVLTHYTRRKYIDHVAFKALSGFFHISLASINWYDLAKTSHSRLWQ